MYPLRVVLRCQDHRFGARQAAGVLPAARLTEHVEAADVAPHDATLAHLLGRSVDLRDVALRRRGELADHVDVLLLLDQRLPPPRPGSRLFAYHASLAHPRYE